MNIVQVTIDFYNQLCWRPVNAPLVCWCWEGTGLQEMKTTSEGGEIKYNQSITAR